MTKVQHKNWPYPAQLSSTVHSSVFSWCALLRELWKALIQSRTPASAKRSLRLYPSEFTILRVVLIQYRRDNFEKSNIYVGTSHVLLTNIPYLEGSYHSVRGSDLIKGPKKISVQLYRAPRKYLSGCTDNWLRGCSYMCHWEPRKYLSSCTDPCRPERLYIYVSQITKIISFRLYRSQRGSSHICITENLDNIFPTVQIRFPGTQATILWETVIQSRRDREGRKGSKTDHVYRDAR